MTNETQTGERKRIDCASASDRDKQGWGTVRLRRLWGQINDLADSVSQGYVSINDLMKVLDEDGYVLQKEGTGA